MPVAEIAVREEERLASDVGGVESSAVRAVGLALVSDPACYSGSSTSAEPEPALVVAPELELGPAG